MLIESAEAKVLGRDSVDNSAFWEDAEGTGFDVNGFAVTDEEEVENGFEGATVPVENGFEDEGPVKGFAPNKDSPIWVIGFAGWVIALRLASLGFFSFGAISVTRNPRNTRTLPCFRLQVLRLHDKIYNQRSWPGNSGTSPFSWRRRTIMSLHILHLARAADGGDIESIHVSGSVSMLSREMVFARFNSMY